MRHFRRAFVVVVPSLVVAVAFASGCSSRADNSPDDREIVPECRSYLDQLSKCTQSISPNVAAQRTAATRQAFAIAAKDDAARERLSAQCRAAEQQISRACR